MEKKYKLSEIPTLDRVHVIDNYHGSKWNYVVEGDKVYSSLKGKDEWSDISSNKNAQLNLLKFLNDKYDFKGYTDVERNLYKQLSQPDKPKEKYSPRLKDVSVIPYGSLTRVPIKDMQTPKREEPTSKSGVKDWIINMYSLAFNYVSRQKEKNEENDLVSSISPVAMEAGYYGIIPSSFVGDTIRVDNRRYIVPENIDISGHSFGFRNRGDNIEIISVAAPITAFTPFKKYGDHVEGYNTYIGIDKNGKLKVGSIENFSDGDYLTGTYSNVVKGFAKDDSGSYVWQSDDKHGNRSKNVPGVIIVGEDGLESVKFPLNILQNKSDGLGNTYGNITGGRVLVDVGGELRLLSGSVSDIESMFEEMKSRHNVDRGIFYTLDNGSFNRGLRTYDGRFTSEDLRKYDLQNTGDSGNFLYIKGPANSFKQDTVWTPNIRTVNDESYKKGHPLINEKQGVVLHHTGYEEDDLGGVTSRFSAQGNSSAHVVIGYNGDRRIFANPDDVTFHAGESRHKGRENVNDFMLGIEFQGNTLKKPLTEEQIKSAVEYLRPLIQKYKISIDDITTHERVRSDYLREHGKRSAETKIDISPRDYVAILKELMKNTYYENSGL